MKKIIQLIFSFLFLYNSVSAQECNSGGCTNLIKNYPTSPYGGASNPFTATASWSTINSTINGGNYAYYNVSVGNTYNWTTCSSYGGFTGFDAELTIFDCNGNKICYSNDNCDGTGPFLSWTATCTGIVKILVSAYTTTGGYCQNNGPTGPYCTLIWKLAGCTGWATIPASAHFTSSGGNNSFAVNTTTGGCSYSAASNNTWVNNITLSQGTVLYKVDANTSSARTGTISIKDANQTTQVSFTINQEAAPSGCTAPTSSAPSDKTVISPASETFTVNASGTSPYTYQWQVLPPSGSWSNLNNSGNNTWTTSGSSSTLTISNTTGLNNYQYRCIVSNGCNPAATSTSATLTVNTSVTTYTISGNITYNGNALNGVTLTGSPGNYSTSTGSSGNYSLSVPSGWSGTVIPSLTNYSFTPLSIPYSNISINKTSQNYTASTVALTTYWMGGFCNPISHPYLRTPILSSLTSNTGASSPLKICADGSNATVIQLNCDNPNLDMHNIRFKVESDPNNLNSNLYGGFFNYSSTSSIAEARLTHPNYLNGSIVKRDDTLLAFDISNPSIILLRFPISIYRAPVLFVHGLWGNSSSFVDMDNYFKNQSGSQNLVTRRADYNQSSGASFSENKLEVYTNVYSLLGTAINQKFSCSKVDVITHSMGGVLTRLYLQSNLYKNDIHTLTTINTPHSGTQAANLLLSKYGVDVSLIMNKADMCTNCGGVNDLRSNSEYAKNNLDGNLRKVPSLVYVSYDYYEPPYFEKNDWLPIELIWNDYKNDFKMKFGINSISELITSLYHGYENDAIVPINSQKGGIAIGDWYKVYGHNFHTIAEKNYSLFSDLFNKLGKNPLSFNLSGFQNTILQLPWWLENSNINRNQEIFYDSVKIESFQTNVHSNDTIDLKVHRLSGNINYLGLLIKSGSNISLIDTISETLVYKYVVPSNSLNVNITAFGFDSAHTIAYDSISFNITTNATLDSIRFLNKQILIPKNYNKIIEVDGFYNDYNNKKISQLVSFRSLDTNIVTVSSTKIFGKQVGSTMVVGKYGLLSDTLYLTVYEEENFKKALFAVDNNIICKSANVKFLDQSAGLPLSWNWNFPGGNPSTSILQNPVVYYGNFGRYGVTLITTWQDVIDTLYVPDYITVDTITKPAIFLNNAGDSMVLISSLSVNNQWNKNDIPIIGEFNQTYKLAIPGIYKLQTFTDNGCASDTSLPITIPGVYTFTGNGNWDLLSNWNTPIVPPSKVLIGSEIIINNVHEGECTIDRNPTIPLGAKLNVLPGKSLIVILNSAGIVTDIDGNTYQGVNICNQIWTKKNLEVTHYKNGDTIPQVQDPTAWANLTTGAWCYYQNNTANGIVYGKLYNWYAVNDSRGLAPQGWHTPSNTEWTSLADNCLGGYSIVGAKIKTTGTIQTGYGLWSGATNSATNSSRFSGVPSGNRLVNGTFTNVGNSALWWTSTQSTSANAWFQEADMEIDDLSSGANNKKLGMSVRCIKD